jgi:general secretion pathway protein N
MTKVLLAALVLGLGGLLYWQWSDWPPSPPEQVAGQMPSDAPVTTSPDPLAVLAPAEDREEYAAIKDRPLFRPDRRPQAQEPTDVVEAPPEVETDLAGFDLTGVIISPAITTAWVKDPTQQTPVRVRPGESLAGWTVKDILGDRLVVERQGKSDTLYLRDFRAPGAPGITKPPVTPPRAAAPPGSAAGNRQPPGGQPPPARTPAAGNRQPPGGQPSPAKTPTAAPSGADASGAKGASARVRPPAGTPQSRPNVRPPSENPN